MAYALMAIARVLAINLGLKANHGDLHPPCAAAKQVTEESVDHLRERKDAQLKDL